MPKSLILRSIKSWFLKDSELKNQKENQEHETHSWWQVMCLTGVDYFSTLGYQPSIAFLAAGALSPIATFILVLITLFGAYPVYKRVAKHSPDGRGSISILENLFPRWKGKAIVLLLLGFAATDFIITMTLSAADSTAHIIENPFVPAFLHHKIIITLFLLLVLGFIFMRGMREAINIAVFTVFIYLFLNIIVIVKGILIIADNLHLISQWQNLVWQSNQQNPFIIIGLALILFPKLALGLSGFETGVAVMPLVKGKDEEQKVKNTGKLLLTAALIMSVLLIASSFITALLIDPKEFAAGGEANGRALAYLAHKHLGLVFGTVYDISTIIILSFAGASAMAGLLNLVPRYLPHYGMAPSWAKASKPLVFVFTIISFLVTIWFQADVDAQGGAYATGVLVLMTSAALSVTIIHWKDKLKWPFLLITLVFVYTTILNIFEKPDGIRIATFFIALTVMTSLISRAMRSTELRISNVYLDKEAEALIENDHDQIIRIVAHRPDNGSIEEYDFKDAQARELHHLDKEEQLLFIEVLLGDASDFDAPLYVKGIQVGKHKILRSHSPAVSNAIAALLIYIGEKTGKLPHAYFGWTEGNPLGYLFRYIFLGEGDVAPMAREVLRQRIPNPKKRPYIHVS